MELGVDSAPAYVQRRGLASPPIEVRELSGGVSCTALEVRAQGLHAVVKQALPKLRVSDEWLAKPERATTEAAALRFAGGLAPGRVPQVLDSDPQECAITMRAAPDNWTSWKSALLEGRADPRVARELGRVLAIWHGAGRLERFDDDEAFEQLRVDPYYRTVARRRPELAPHIERYIERMAATKQCVVHGDFSPKNVLVSPSGEELWVIDWEVAHTGDPAFDLAFMSNHLLLKAIHRPDVQTAYRACLEGLFDGYGFAGDLAYVFGHVGCLMVARVDGKSPAEYLTEAGRDAARRAGASLLTDPPSSPADAWSRVRSYR